MNCLQCNNTTSNPKFCSRSCAAIYNNIHYPKRYKGKNYYCKKCGNQLPKYRGRCSQCNPKNLIQLRTKGYYAKGNANSFGYPAIRANARASYMKKVKHPSCEICGYDVHIDVHHKKPIQDFDDSVLVSVINDISNLVGLCPNHHWEADHNMITL